MLRTSFYAPDFETADWTDLRPRPAQPGASASGTAAATLRTARDALREAFSAYRRYECLKSRGIPHDPALREALDLRRPAGRIGIASLRTPPRRRFPLLARCVRWWQDRDKGARALAAVDDDHLSDLSDLGRQVRRTKRQQRATAMHAFAE